MPNLQRHFSQLERHNPETSITFIQVQQFLSISSKYLHYLIREGDVLRNKVGFNGREVFQTTEIEKIRPSLTGKPFITYHDWINSSGSICTVKCRGCDTKFIRQIHKQQFCNKDCQSKYNANRYHRLKEEK